jgi:hypothetical protein
VDGPEGRITALAASQHGVVSSQQVRSLGATRHQVAGRVTAGHWNRVHPGVYVVGGAPRTFAQRVMAALLAAGPGAFASHRTAAFLWGLIERPHPRVEVTVAYPRSHRLDGVIVHRSRDVHLAGVLRHDGIALAGASRTLLDLGAVAPRQVRPATWAALRSRSTAWDVLLRTLIAHAKPGRDGVGALRVVVAEHYGELGTDSETEDLAYTILADSRRVPLPQKQVRVVCADGVEVSVDLGWPDRRCLVEVFGVDHFTNEDLVHIDLHRRNQIELAGYRLLIYSGRLLRRQPERFVLDVEALLAGGADGMPAS